MAQIRENKTKHKLKRGEIVTVTSGYQTADMIDFLGPFGFDAAWIESEHGPIDFAEIPDMTRACDLWGINSLVRVNLNAPGVIYRTLDLGAQGVVVPHINTAEEARAVVEASKFSPIGSRGMFTSRQGFGVEDYFSKANDETMVVVLIEDIVAINNLSEILSVDHIDVFFVAPSDLAQTMGYLGQPRHPEVLATIDEAVAQIVSAGKVTGTVITDSSVEDYINKGVQFLMNRWPDWLASGAKAFLNKVKSAS